MTFLPLWIPMAGVLRALLAGLFLHAFSDGAPVVFRGSISPLPPQVLHNARLSSWRPGCPVSLDQLVYVRVSHHGTDGQVHEGELLVHAQVAESILAALGALFDLGFPIEKMRLIDAYGGDDDASMADNNTSAFNCREVSGRPGVWSRHAYGMAIDINPLVNPYVVGGTVSPPQGAAYASANTAVPGAIRAGSKVVEIFQRIGFSWGGDFVRTKDYQHFQK